MGTVQIDFILVICAYYALVSGVALLVMAHDKLAARMQRQRVPEKHLHLISVIGGWPGTWFASMLFRHKIRKQGFKLYQVIATVMNLVLLMAALKMLTTYWMNP